MICLVVSPSEDGDKQSPKYVGVLTFNLFLVFKRNRVDYDCEFVGK
jgi:hypothetical protein